MSILYYFVLFVAALIIVALILIAASVFGLWLQCYLSGAPVSAIQIVGMKLRKSPAKEIVAARIKCIQSGIPPNEAPTVYHLESHALAGGNVNKVIDEFVASHRSGKGLAFEQLAAEDLGSGLANSAPPQHFKNQPLANRESSSGGGPSLIGTRLQASMAIPPAGRIELAGQDLLALSDDVEIRRGETIEVVRIEGNVAIVRRI